MWLLIVLLGVIRYEKIFGDQQMSLYIIMMGIQGAGKGVQAGFISETYGIPHVSTGDLFRAMKNRDDDLAREVRAIMSAGQLVSDELTNRIVEDRLAQDDAKNGAILDGYPRSAGQCDWLDAYLASKGEKLTVALLMELDPYTAFKRAFGRVSAPDGESYNYFYKQEGITWRWEEHETQAFPPRLIATREGAVLQRRPDDASASSILKRIDTFVETTQPLIQRYEASGQLVRINALLSIETINAQIQLILESRS